MNELEGVKTYLESCESTINKILEDYQNATGCYIRVTEDHRQINGGSMYLTSIKLSSVFTTKGGS